MHERSIKNLRDLYRTEFRELHRCHTSPHLKQDRMEECNKVAKVLKESLLAVGPFLPVEVKETKSRRAVPVVVDPANAGSVEY